MKKIDFLAKIYFKPDFEVFKSNDSGLENRIFFVFLKVEKNIYRNFPHFFGFKKCKILQNPYFRNKYWVFFMTKN